MLIELKNGPATAVVDSHRGGDIVSYRDQRVDTEILWRRNPQPPESDHLPELNHNTQAFYDTYEGGVQELFPNTADPTTVLGANLPFHGELCKTPMDIVEHTSDAVTLSCTLKRYPVKVIRKISVSDQGVLTVSSSVTNLSSRDLPYSWALHPVFSEYFTGQGSFVWCQATGAQAHPTEFSVSQSYEPGATVDLATGELGDYIPLSDPHSGTADLVYIDVSEKWFQLGKKDDFNISFRWTNDDFNCLWLWQECHVDTDWPWWGQYHVVGVEPHTTYPAARLDEHIANGRHKTLAGHATAEASFSFEVVEGIEMGKVDKS